MGSPAALALPSLEFSNGLKIDSQITANYTYSFRTRSADSHYLSPMALNADDGTRNVDRYAPVNNLVSLSGEIVANKDNDGPVLRARHFYYDLYKGTNDDDSAATVNR